MPITRTNTGESNVLSASLDTFNTTLTFGKVTPQSPSGSPTLPPFDVKFFFDIGCKGDTNPHFHVDKTEYLYIEQGRVRVTLNGVSKMVGREDGQIVILPWTPHRWEVLGTESTPTVVLERTEPADGRKEAFFRNLLSLLIDYGGFPPVLQVMKIFADYDNYPSGMGAWMGWRGVRGGIVWITKGVGWVAGLAGYSSMYKEYMPRGLYASLQ